MKIRLDQLLYNKGITTSLEAARAMIGAGEVFIDDKIADKPGVLYASSVSIRLKDRCPYVSRGGFKLEEGLTHFKIDPTGWICIDIGASTGGFTDCLLQHNAKKVYAIDVAYGQISWKIRQDTRVITLERFNARNISSSDIKETGIDLAVMDVSFISITTLLPALLPLFRKRVKVLALIKPQFELSKEEVGKGGVVSLPNLHQKAIEKIVGFIERIGLINNGVIASPILGPKGNREFLISISSKLDIL